MRSLNEITALRIIHRDIKPENILVNDVGDIQVIDFGLAIELPEGVIEIEQISYVGTEYYIAPEIKIKNSDSNIQNPKRDVFSLGMVLAALWGGLDDYYLDENPPNYFSEYSGSAEEILSKLFKGLTATDKKALKDANLENAIKELLLGMLNFEPELRINIEQAIEQFAKIEIATKTYLESLSESQRTIEEEEDAYEESNSEDNSLFQTRLDESLDNTRSDLFADDNENNEDQEVSPPAITTHSSSRRESSSSSPAPVTPGGAAISVPHSPTLSATLTPITPQSPITPTTGQDLTTEIDEGKATNTSAIAPEATTPINNGIKSRPFWSKTKVAAVITAGLILGAGIGTGLVLSGVLAPLGAAVLGIVFMVGTHTAAGGILAGLFLAALALFRKTDNSPKKQTSDESQTSAKPLAALSKGITTSEPTYASPGHYSSPIAAPKQSQATTSTPVNGLNNTAGLTS